MVSVENMREKIKKMCKMIFPLPATNHIRRLEIIEAHLNKLETVVNELGAVVNRLALDERLQNGQKELQEKIKRIENLAEKRFKEDLRSTEELKGKIQELEWAVIFQDSIKNSWLEHVGLSLGRWAIGYPFAYILFRTLEAQKPLNILELGLGESTKIILSYKKQSQNPVKHNVVEASEEWLEFFQRSNADLIGDTELVNLKYQFAKFRQFQDIRVFKGFEEKFKSNKYDLICIDAPLGGDMKEICRVDILSIIPDSLNSTFVILLDDFNRQTEKNLAKLIFEELDKNQIAYVSGSYNGEKSTLLIASPDLDYLTSL